MTKARKDAIVFSVQILMKTPACNEVCELDDAAKHFAALAERFRDYGVKTNSLQ
jgi:hypothetical protein